MRKYSSNLAFVDLLFNLILGFVFLFVVSFLLINDPTKEAHVEEKAEYMIIMSWNNDRGVDVDLWVEGPEGLVGFRNTQQGFMNLDRDDLGHRNDIIKKGPNAGQIVEINREVVNIRGFQPGEYVVNAHYYFTNLGPVKSRIQVDVEVIKLNPYSQVFIGTREFSFRGEEQTFVRFTMKPDGTYYGVNTLKKDLVSSLNHLLSPAVEARTSFGNTIPNGPSGGF